MEDIFEEIHFEFITSEDYIGYLIYLDQQNEQGGI
jgi:hypothetical protein